jgi:hypothetical protein
MKSIRQESLIIGCSLLILAHLHENSFFGIIFLIIGILEIVIYSLNENYTTKI